MENLLLEARMFCSILAGENEASTFRKPRAEVRVFCVVFDLWEELKRDYCDTNCCEAGNIRA